MNLPTGYRLLAVCAAHRDKFSPKSSCKFNVIITFNFGRAKLCYKFKEKLKQTKTSCNITIS